MQNTVNGVIPTLGEYMLAKYLFTIILSVSLLINCSNTQQSTDSQNPIVGAEQLYRYLPLLTNKRVSLVANQTALVSYTVYNNHGNDGGSNNETDDRSADERADSSTLQSSSVHLLDALLANDVNVTAVMSPEHGFRGDKGAGEKINSDVDAKTGLPIYSLYGKTKKPTPEMLSDVDVLVFDIQDVGVRFYTYLSTLHYVIEAAFENNVDVVVFDRPNPNGGYIDGPILESAFSSFVGIHPIPVLHGMTLGELAKMMVGERWVKKPEDSTSTLTVIPVANYARTDTYILPVAPSPNLPNSTAITLYPTLCFFEGTDISVGRGTSLPFQLIGHPTVELGNERISVKANSGAPHPKHENKLLYAQLLNKVREPSDAQNKTAISGLHLETLINSYRAFQKSNIDESHFSNSASASQPVFFSRPAFFDKLAGTDQLRLMIENGRSAKDIKQSWAKKLDEFKAKRQPYLMYP